MWRFWIKKFFHKSKRTFANGFVCSGVIDSVISIQFTTLQTQILLQKIGLEHVQIQRKRTIQPPNMQELATTTKVHLNFNIVKIATKLFANAFNWKFVQFLLIAIKYVHQGWQIVCKEIDINTFDACIFIERQNWLSDVSFNFHLQKNCL